MFKAKLGDPGLGSLGPSRAGRLLFSGLALAGMLMVTACAPLKEAQDGAKKKPIQTVWPEPPDEARFQYKWRLRSAADLEPPVELKNVLKGLGEKASDQPAFTRPAGIAARNGLIYVADSQGQGVVVFDVPRRKVFKFGQREPNTLEKPMAVALDAKGQVYVLDVKRKKVMVFDPLGLYQFEVGDPAILARPASVAVNREGTRIYIVDRGSTDGDDHRVLAYNEKGERLFDIGPRGRGEGQFNIPLDATVDADGTLYVVDSGNFRVQLFSPEGKFRMAFGGPGNRLGQFSRPRGVAVGADGNIYVTDAVYNNVQIFNSQGELLMPLGKVDIDKDLPGNYGLIAGVAVDEKNHLYVVDQYFNKVEIFSRLE